MLRSKTCLADVNVWLALAVERHEHHPVARRWFLSRGEEGATFCRVTQMGFLRLLTNRTAMGEEVLDPLEAWEGYQQLRRDWRVGFAAEPAGMEAAWLELMKSGAPARSWTDAYLAAFAASHGYTLTSFDRGFRRWESLRLELLPGR
jgi:toxin-antitoxin system PIN domain toxin